MRNVHNALIISEKTLLLFESEQHGRVPRNSDWNRRGVLATSFHALLADCNKYRLGMRAKDC